MTPTFQDSLKLSDALRSFLVEAGWAELRFARGMVFYGAPESLGIQGKFSVALPLDPVSKGATNLLHSAANSLVQIYGYGSLGDLLNHAAASVSGQSEPTRFITRFIGTSTKNGTIPLGALAAYTANIEASLYRSAKFKLGAESKVNQLIAERFAKECLFMQTEEGSFIAKVEIPNVVLKQGDLFGGEPLVSAEIGSSLFSAIQFLNQNVLATEDAFESSEALADAIVLFDVELLESLTKVVVGQEMDCIDFSVEVGSQVRTSSTGWLSAEKKQRLKDFFEFVKDQLRGENDLDVTGAIVELRSRDPEGNKNYIRVVTNFHGDRTYLSATLSNEQYQRAVDAHRNKRLVRLKGNGTRLKTQIRVTEVVDFVT